MVIERELLQRLCTRYWQTVPSLKLFGRYSWSQCSKFLMNF